jgi:Hint domain
MADRLPSSTNLARRHFMRIAAAGAGRLSAVAAVSVLFASKRADAMGWFPRDNPNHHCFGRGTLIRTDHGEVPVEDLAIGDMVMTTNGAMPVKWLGRRTIGRGASASWHPAVLPIRVAKFAIDEQTPSRDLYLSQGHSLLIDGVLIPADHLVNGQSIVVDHDAKASETIEYFSVELETHQAIFAEGMTVETFRHGGGPVAWDNIADYEKLYGRERQVMPPFAPLCYYKGGRAEVRALLRLATSRVRDPIQVAYARIAARARSLAA